MDQSIFSKLVLIIQCRKIRHFLFNGLTRTDYFQTWVANHGIIKGNEKFQRGRDEITLY